MTNSNDGDTKKYFGVMGNNSSKRHEPGPDFYNRKLDHDEVTSAWCVGCGFSKGITKEDIEIAKEELDIIPDTTIPMSKQYLELEICWVCRGGGSASVNQGARFVKI